MICNRNTEPVRSGTQPFAAPGAPRRQDLAAAFTRHTRAKAVAALAYELARLIGPFHGCLRCAAYRGDKPPRLRRLIREGSWPVNVTYPRFSAILLESCDGSRSHAAAAVISPVVKCAQMRQGQIYHARVL